MDDGTTQSALRHCQRPPDLDKLMNAAADEMDAQAQKIERLRRFVATVEEFTATGDGLSPAHCVQLNQEAERLLNAPHNQEASK